MFRPHVEVLIESIKALEQSLKENQKTAHLSKDNVEEIQKTISFLSKEIVLYYEAKALEITKNLKESR